MLPTTTGIFKGTVSQDFRPSVFSLNGRNPWVPDLWAEEVSTTDSNSRRNSIRFDYEDRFRAMPHSSVADPGSGAFLPPGSGIRDGAMVGSRSGISKQNLLIAFIQI
jgi:hypothetical protein